MLGEEQARRGKKNMENSKINKKAKQFHEQWIERQTRKRDEEARRTKCED